MDDEFFTCAWCWMKSHKVIAVSNLKTNANPNMCALNLLLWLNDLV